MLNLLMTLAVLSAPAHPIVATAHDLSVRRPSLLAPGALRLVHEPSTNAIRAYEELRFWKASERAELVRQLPPRMQADIWAYHFLTTLVEHPELTAEQRGVIQEALSLLTPELFEIEPSSSQWGDLVDKPLRALEHRAKAAFTDRKFVRAIFAQLGPDPEPGSVDNRTFLLGSFFPPPRLGHPRTEEDVDTDAVNCTCSVVSDYCDTFGGLGALVCRNTWCKFSSSGCGTFFRYTCEGLCFYNRPSG